MKKYLILLIIPFMMFASCMEDKSAYLPQDKENVSVDDPTKDEDNPNPPGEFELIPGVQAITLNVEGKDGTMLERKFKYFMPVSIDKNQPVSLIFDFHGSWEYEGMSAPNPIEGITISHSLNQHAIKTNCIIVHPAGLPQISTGGKNFVNWTDTDNNLRFVDAMIEFFKKRTPTIDASRIYSTGQSSGAIFSFVLAFERSNVFAAVAPRAGQMSLRDESIIPSRAVPIIAFNGKKDDIVTGYLSNMIAWAEKVGGYFENDMQFSAKDTLDIPGYKKYQPRTWTGAKADLQLIELIDEGHGVSLGNVLPIMWEFLSAHTLNSTSTKLFITASRDSIVAQEKETFDVGLNYTDGATFSYTSPDDWGVVLDGKTLRVTAPSDFYSCVSKGEIQLKVTLNGVAVERSIYVELKSPKQYFEVGDIYYNSDRKPVGVVVWVNMKNKKEAKIVNLEHPGAYETIYFNAAAIGASFETPDHNDGVGNTAALVTQNNTLSSPNTASTSAYVWANTYNYQGVGGWYLPAINEWAAIAPNFDLINTAIASIGGKPLAKVKYYSSTTKLVDADAKTKNFYYFNFSTKKEEIQLTTNEYTGYNAARILKKVTK